MKLVYALTLGVVALPVLAAETVPLPAEVTAYLQRDRQTPACRPKNTAGLSMEEIVDNLIIARRSPECAALERERLALLERYKDNKDVVNALTLKIGFIGQAI